MGRGGCARCGGRGLEGVRRQQLDGVRASCRAQAAARAGHAARVCCRGAAAGVSWGLRSRSSDARMRRGASAAGAGSAGSAAWRRRGAGRGRTCAERCGWAGASPPCACPGPCASPAVEPCPAPAVDSRVLARACCLLPCLLHACCALLHTVDALARARGGAAWHRGSGCLGSGG